MSNPHMAKYANETLRKIKKQVNLDVANWMKSVSGADKNS